MARFILRKNNNVDKYLWKIRQGDCSALEPLYEQTSKQLYSLCYTYMHSKQKSEDALSETYLAVVRNIDKYIGSSGFNWLYTICKNICINALRKNEKSVFVDFNDEQTANVLDISSSCEVKATDESGIIALSEKVLDDKEFKIVIMHTVSGMKFKEITKIVGGKESTVRWQYNNAIKKVKIAYERREKNEK